MFEKIVLNVVDSFGKDWMGRCKKDRGHIESMGEVQCS